MSETEPDENIASDNQRRKSEDIETIENSVKEVEIESNKCSVTEKHVQEECPIEIASNQTNQKNNDKNVAKTKVETTNEAETKVDDEITTKTDTPTETNDSNIKQTVPTKEPSEAIKISETTPNDQIAQDAKATDETPQRNESIAEKNDNKTVTIKSISCENNSTTETTTTKATTTTTTSDPSDEYAEHITYTDDGNAIYTDPKTDHKYKWSAKENNWLYWKSGEKLTDNHSAASTNDNPYENEHYKWCSEKNQWILKSQSVEATTTLSASQTETEHYKWDAAKNAWIPKLQTQQAATALAAAETTQPDAVTYGIDKDGQRIYTDKDGVVFFWDVEKNAWFPKIDDDFMARYQMNYGFIDNTSASEEERKLKEQAAEKHKELELQEMVKEARAATEATAAGVGGCGLAAGVKRKVAQEPPSWFDLNPEQNTKVYVSNLPLDITLDEFTELMSKCGMIMRDPKTQKHKLKLYTEEDGQIKGDGLCDYIKVESVELALKILDEYEVRGHKIRVQRAKFQMRGEYNPSLKPKRKKKDKEKLQKMKEKLFDWRPEKLRGERTKNEKVVILKNLFTPELFEKEVQLILDYQNDLREECSKCGTVRKVVIYDLHAEGVAQVNMSSPEEADLVIQMMHGRYFGKRQLTAEHWDGKTKYKIAETETAAKSRLNNWDEFLETDEDKRHTMPTSSVESTTTINTDDAAA